MKRYVYPLLTLLLVLPACGVDEPFEPEDGPLAFRASVAPVPATRSDAVSLGTTPSGEVEAFLRPMGPVFTDDSLSTRGAPVTSMYDRFSFLSDEGLRGNAVRSGDRFLVGGLQYYALPKDEGNRFFCWGPSDAPGVSETEGKLHYSAPADVSRQPDLVVAVSPGMARLDKGPTPLEFTHALAGLQVSAGTVFPGCTVNSLVLHGVVTEGTYDLQEGGWALGTAKEDFVLLPQGAPASAGSAISSGDWTAMLVPQTFSPDANLTISLTYEGRKFDYAVPLEGLELRAGCILTVGIGCRSLYLFEGTAAGAFSVFYYKGVASGTAFYKICDVPVEEDGTFSVLVPALTGALHSYSFARNDRLLTVTRLPDILLSRQSYQRMFSGCSALVGVYCDIPHGNVTNWAFAFYNCASLTDLPEEIDTGGGTDFNSMFYGCKKLKKAPVMDTSAGVDFRSMFQGCAALKELPEYRLGNGTNFSSMFQGCKALTEIPAYSMPRGTHFTAFCRDCSSLTAVPELVTSAGTIFSYAFCGCTALREVALIDTGRGTNFTSMFQNCKSLTTIPLLNTSRGTAFREMFQGCSLLTGIPLLDTSKGTTFYLTFGGCTALTACPELDTSSATNLYGMFQNCTSLRETWPYSTSRTTNFAKMFQGCTSLVRVDLFDTSSGTAFDNMFTDCRALPAVPAFSFVKNSTNTYMFTSCKSLTAIPDWDWSHMTSCAHMFEGCTALQEIGTRVNTSACTNFISMFLGCTALRSVASIDVGSMTSGTTMFAKCSALEEAPDLDAPSAASITEMFDGCTRLSTVGRIAFPRAGDWHAFFRNCTSLRALQDADLSGVTNLNECFSCYFGGALTSLQAIPAQAVTDASNVLSGQTKLKDFGGFPGIAVSFSVSDCTALSRASLLNVLEGLAEVSQACTLTLGETLRAKLTEEEIRTATDKGWTVL